MLYQLGMYILYIMGTGNMLYTPTARQRSRHHMQWQCGLPDTRPLSYAGRGHTRHQCRMRSNIKFEMQVSGSQSFFSCVQRAEAVSSSQQCFVLIAQRKLFWQTVTQWQRQCVPTACSIFVGVPVTLFKISDAHQVGTRLKVCEQSLNSENSEALKQQCFWLSRFLATFYFYYSRNGLTDKIHKPCKRTSSSFLSGTSTCTQRVTTDRGNQAAKWHVLLDARC